MSKEEKLVKCESCGGYKRIITSHKCDTCGKPNAVFPINVTVHTDRWGNDSCDSYEYLEYCSLDCLADMTNDYIGDDSWEFEINMDGEYLNHFLKTLNRARGVE